MLVLYLRADNRLGVRVRRCMQKPTRRKTSLSLDGARSPREELHRCERVCAREQFAPSLGRLGMVALSRLDR
ncbi:hypothetical protein PBY51_002167 [Eleginops maclovinus]|uniref:Uncharacterized protein n=1 Tax=Eleginops maclovinus TaxID=56733 RepID=A0AAN7X1W7_ELEMC|nr:hypothetical protein PBY51_002167 [Eleginops maclovinus]